MQFLETECCIKQWKWSSFYSMPLTVLLNAWNCVWPFSQMAQRGSKLRLSNCFTRTSEFPFWPFFCYRDLKLSYMEGRIWEWGLDLSQVALTFQNVFVSINSVIEMIKIEAEIEVEIDIDREREKWRHIKRQGGERERERQRWRQTDIVLSSRVSGTQMFTSWGQFTSFKPLLSNEMNCPLLVLVSVGITVSARKTHFRCLTYRQRKLGDRYLLQGVAHRHLSQTKETRLNLLSCEKASSVNTSAVQGPYQDLLC